MFAEGRSDTLHAIQLSPRDPGLGLWYATLAASDIGLGNSDDAITDGHRAIDAGYRTFVVYSNLAAACAMSNRIDDARAAVAEALKLNPKYSLKLMSEQYHKPPVVVEALRKAGRLRSDRGSSQRHWLGERLLLPIAMSTTAIGNDGLKSVTAGCCAQIGGVPRRYGQQAITTRKRSFSGRSRFPSIT